MSHVRGLQFRYVLFLCDDRESKRLLAESPFSWKREDYPKDTDCTWTIRGSAKKRKWEPDVKKVFEGAFDV